MKEFLLIKTPIGTVPMIDCDAVASGPYQKNNNVDKFMENNILPYYNNTHSNSHNGKYMCQYIDLTRKTLKDIYCIQDPYEIIFTGNGCTQAINDTLELLDLNPKTVIITSEMEHHSNLLPWKTNYLNVEFVKLKENKIDLIDMEKKIRKYYLKKKPIFATFTGCSNITGIRQNIKEIRRITKKYKVPLLIDYAASAPYYKINPLLSDISVFSGHKFKNALNVPGIIIINKKLIKNKKICPGGGSIRYMSRNKIKFNNKLEKGGTPNITGIIRFGKVVSQVNFDKINIRHQEIINLVQKYGSKYNLFSDFGLKLVSKYQNMDIPIFSFIVENNHYNLFVKILNDFFGIQSRGGISCASLMAINILGKQNYTKIYQDIDRNKGVNKNYGWCRIHFHYDMTNDEIIYTLIAILFVSKNINKLKGRYVYNKEKNNWFHKNETKNTIDWEIKIPQYQKLNLISYINKKINKYNKFL